MKLEEFAKIVQRLRALKDALSWESCVEGRDHTSGSSFLRIRNIEIEGLSPAEQDFIANAPLDMEALIQALLDIKSTEWRLVR